MSLLAATMAQIIRVGGAPPGPVDGSGTGTSGDPYLIGSYATLELLRTHRSGNYFKLIADIDCGDANWESVASFNGYIDGDWHKIYNFNSTSTSNATGLIRSSNGYLEIKRLGIEGGTSGVSTSSTLYCGYFNAVPSSNHAMLIEDCYCNGPINNGGDRGGNISGIHQSGGVQTFRRVWAGTDRGGSAQGSRSGGIVFQFTGIPVVDGAYYSTLGLTGNPGISRTTAQAQDAGNFPQFDFVNHWQIGANGPEFQPK